MYNFISRFALDFLDDVGPSVLSHHITSESRKRHYPISLHERKHVNTSHSTLTLTVLVTTIDAQWEGMGDVGSVRYEPALLPPCPTIRALSYSN